MKPAARNLYPRPVLLEGGERTDVVGLRKFSLTNTNCFVYSRSMAKGNRPLPTDAELEILRVLWTRGPSTVREVFQGLKRAKPVGYTTVLKLMQIMAEKGLVRRNEEQRTHVYEAMVPKESTQRQIVGDLLDRAFGGSAAQLVMQALSAKRATAAEIEQIRRLLNEYQEKPK
jgi:BlaI family transcriptional regulator, penicillinase repressor